MIQYPYWHIGGRPDVGALIEMEQGGREDACHVAGDGYSDGDSDGSKMLLMNFPYVCFAFRYVLHKVYVSPSDRSVAPDKDIAKHATEVDFPLLQI